MVAKYVRLEEKKRRELGRNLLVREYNELMEQAGCPKVWIVDSAITHSIYSSVYLTEEEARESYNRIPETAYRKLYRTWDIWGYTERLQTAP